MGLGSARDVTLAQARKRVEELRVNHVSKKIDPLAERKAADEAKRVASAKAIPFRVRADQFIAAHEGEWRNPKHRAQWRATLETYAFPVVGDLPATAITAAHIAALLRSIWVEKAETARRVRQRIEAVLDYAADPDEFRLPQPRGFDPAAQEGIAALEQGPQAIAASFAGLRRRGRLNDRATGQGADGCNGSGACAAIHDLDRGAHQ